MKIKMLATGLAVGIVAFALPKSEVSANQTKQWYYVRAGDSYYKIAKEFGIDVSKFDLEAELRADSKIEIPGYVLKEYVLQEGDSLYSLAEENGIKVKWIQMANSMEGTKLLANSEILLPVKSSDEYTSGDLGKNISQESQDIKKGGKSNLNSQIGENGLYTVRRGDTLTSISKANNLTISQLLKLNPMVKNPNFICEGQKLKMCESDEKIGIEQKCDNYQWLSDAIESSKKEYPGMEISVAIYKNSTGEYLYKENIYTQISSACTVKAIYALYVLQQCESNNIDINTQTLLFSEEMRNNGSGTINTMEANQSFTISFLLEKLIKISDNTAYNILLSKFKLSDFERYLKTINGQNLYECRYGTCAAYQRVNEWIKIKDYCDSDALYSNVLKELLSSAKYSYLAQGFENWHQYMHKSGWADGKSYNSCSDCMLIGDYIIVVLTHDYKECIAHTNVVRNIGNLCDKYLF